MTIALSIAIIKTIRSAGYCVGWTVVNDGRFVANAVNGKTCESFTAADADEQRVWIELARQVGIDLEG